MEDGMVLHPDANVIIIEKRRLYLKLLIDWRDLCLTAVYCLEPPIINNGGFRLSNNSTVAGTVVEYYCLTNSRYRMSGPSKIVCQSDGHYDQDPPVDNIHRFSRIIISFLREMAVLFLEIFRCLS